MSTKTKKQPKRELTCALCGGSAEGEYSVERRGFGEGPDVWLCNKDGSGAMPSLETIWDAIRGKRLPDSAFVNPKERRKR